MEGVSLQQLNGMDYETFTKTFGNVVEHCQLCAAGIWTKRPFANLKQLHTAICEFIDTLPISGKEGILRLHPDLAGKVAQLGCLTNESTKEQSSAGLTQLDSEEKDLLQDLNKRYKSKFGFPFVICARENKKAAILSGMKTRVENEKLVELDKGIAEVKKIAFYRLLDIVQHETHEERL